MEKSKLIKKEKELNISIKLNPRENDSNLNLTLKFVRISLFHSPQNDISLKRNLVLRTIYIYIYIPYIESCIKIKTLLGFDNKTRK